MRSFLVLVAAVAASFALGTSTASALSVEVEGSAKFTVTYGPDKAKYRYGQSKIVPSELGLSEQVPISLHVSPKEDAFDEVVLAGKGKLGKQKTSEALVFSLNLSVRDRDIFMISEEGDCTITIKRLTDEKLAGSFKCDTTYSGHRLTAKGTFKAS